MRQQHRGWAKAVYAPPTEGASASSQGPHLPTVPEVDVANVDHFSSLTLDANPAADDDQVSSASSGRSKLSQGTSVDTAGGMPLRNLRWRMCARGTWELPKLSLGLMDVFEQLKQQRVTRREQRLSAEGAVRPRPGAPSSAPSGSWIGVPADAASQSHLSSWEDVQPTGATSRAGSSRGSDPDWDRVEHGTTVTGWSSDGSWRTVTDHRRQSQEYNPRSFTWNMFGTLRGLFAYTARFTPGRPRRLSRAATDLARSHRARGAVLHPRAPPDAATRRVRPTRKGAEAVRPALLRHLSRQAL